MSRNKQAGQETAELRGGRTREQCSCWTKWTLTEPDGPVNLFFFYIIKQCGSMKQSVFQHTVTTSSNSSRSTDGVTNKSTRERPSSGGSKGPLTTQGLLQKL